MNRESCVPLTALLLIKSVCGHPIVLIKINTILVCSTLITYMWQLHARVNSISGVEDLCLQLQFRIPLLCFYFLIFLDQNCEIN